MTLQCVFFLILLPLASTLVTFRHTCEDCELHPYVQYGLKYERLLTRHRQKLNWYFQTSGVIDCDYMPSYNDVQLYANAIYGFREGLSKADCEAWASTYSTKAMIEGRFGTSRLTGCSVTTFNGEFTVYWNLTPQGLGDANQDGYDVKSSGVGNPSDPTATDCDHIAQQWGATYDNDMTSSNSNLGPSRPRGCFWDLENNHMYYNHVASTTPCSAEFLCVVKNTAYDWLLDRSNVPAYTVEITNDVTKVEGGLFDLATSKISFNKRFDSPALNENRGTCNSDVVCLCQRAKDNDIVTYELGNYAYNALYPKNAVVSETRIRAVTKGTYLEHTLGSCTINNVKFDYYSEDECNHVGGIYDATSTRDVESHFDEVAADVLSQEENPIETKNRTFIIDYLGTPTTASDNVVSYTRSIFRQFVGNTILKKDRNRVTIDCLQRCKTNADCTFASLDARGQCVLHRKCERTKNEVSVEDGKAILQYNVDTYRKVGIHSKRESSLGVTKEGFYHDVAVENFLCKNYKEGKRLHNSFFDVEDSNTLLAGSSFYHLHSQSSLWPTERYVHHDNRFWMSSHPTKAFLKYVNDEEAYIAFTRSEDDPSTPGLQFGHVQTTNCQYTLPKEACLAYANAQLISVGNMDLEGIEEYYLVAEFDEECAMGSLTETQCDQYRVANDFLGSTVNTNTKPTGCSVMVDKTGVGVTEVYYNQYNGNLASSGRLPFEDDTFKTYGLCYGNPNRFNPKGCFIDSKDGNVYFNGDDSFTDCSNEKSCICGFGVSVFDINGGLKEATRQETCANVCSNDPDCNFLQVHDSVCYGLRECDMTNNYEWKIQHNWTVCDEILQVGHEVFAPEVETLDEYLNECANICDAEGLSSEFIYLNKAVIPYEFEYNSFFVKVFTGDALQSDDGKFVSQQECFSYFNGAMTITSNTYNVYGCFYKASALGENKNPGYFNTNSESSVTACDNVDHQCIQKSIAATNLQLSTCDQTTEQIASGTRECAYLTAPSETFTYVPETKKCYAGACQGKKFYTRKEPVENISTCSCLRDSCPSARMYNNFSISQWNQIYQKRVVTEAKEDSKVFSVNNKTNAFPLFPFYGFWDCDAVTYHNTNSADACGDLTAEMHHLVFAYNEYTNVCIVYTHYVEDSESLLLETGEFASWCYKNNVLRSNDAFNYEYGTCDGVGTQIPRVACEGTFEAQSIPELDQFKSYMMGNVKYNVGGVTCESCPLGQSPLPKFGYECRRSIRKHYACAGALVEDCLYGREDRLTMQGCKQECNRLGDCVHFNFKTTNGAAVGSCYLYNAVQLQGDTEESDYTSCERVQTSFECVPCAEGKFLRVKGQRACQNCPVGTFQDETGQASCKACHQGQFQDQTGKTSCKELDQFSMTFEVAQRKLNYDQLKDEYLISFGTQDSSFKCMQIVGESKLRVMVYDSDTGFCEGLYDADFLSAIFASEFLSDEQKFVPCNCNSKVSVVDTSFKVCVNNLLIGVASGPLQDNTVSDTPSNVEGGTEQCAGCANFTIEIPGTDDCEACAPGFHYTASAGRSIRCESCDPGFFRLSEDPFHPLSTYDTPFYNSYDVAVTWPEEGAGVYRCLPCEPGFYMPDPRAVTCVACPSGKYGNTWMMTECLDCPTGQFMDNTGHVALRSDATVCKQCVNGQYQDTEGQTTCRDCLAGKYSDTLGLSTCKNCAAGRFSNTRGNILPACDANNDQKCCQKCSTGYVSTAGSASCTECTAGKYQRGQEYHMCMNCNYGQYQDEKAQTDCKDCKPKTHQDNGGQTSCKDCATGKYSDTNKLRHCKPCEIGQYQDQKRQEKCKDCETGTYEDEGGKSICKQCEKGKYQDQKKQTSCKLCGTGQFGDVKGLVGCKNCAAGKAEHEKGQETCRTSCSASYNAHNSALSFRYSTGKAAYCGACGKCQRTDANSNGEGIGCTNMERYSSSITSTNSNYEFRHIPGQIAGTQLSSDYMGGDSWDYYFQCFRHCRDTYPNRFDSFQIASKTCYCYAGTGYAGKAGWLFFTTYEMGYCHWKRSRVDDYSQVTGNRI